MPAKSGLRLPSRSRFVARWAELVRPPVSGDDLGAMEAARVDYPQITPGSPWLCESRGSRHASRPPAQRSRKERELAVLTGARHSCRYLHPRGSPRRTTRRDRSTSAHCDASRCASRVAIERAVISSWSVGQHLAHCALAAIEVRRDLRSSASPAPRSWRRFLAWWTLTTGRIPRGQACVIPRCRAGRPDRGRSGPDS
jgi:hypothetical protein